MIAPKRKRPRCFQFHFVSKQEKPSIHKPLFSLILLDSDVVIYLDISNDLLAKHCEKRGASFQDAKNVKDAIEEAWNREYEKCDQVFYYLNVME